jgi:transcriptional regulator with XRE-family HTH domain
VSLADRLRRLRQEKNQSLQNVATAVGVSKAHVWEIETGKTRNPSIALVKRLADHFGVSVAWLVGEVPLQGRDQEQKVAIYRAIQELSPQNAQLVQSIIESMRKTS